jgi:hypothetical protein
MANSISKKLTYCFFIAIHILLRWFWLKLFRTTHTITCQKKRLNFENTLYNIEDAVLVCTNSSFDHRSEAILAAINIWMGGRQKKLPFVASLLDFSLYMSSAMSNE